jgi:Cys-tRNA(Pro)/Cys-tRNA(Cys) deacylase
LAASNNATRLLAKNNIEFTAHELRGEKMGAIEAANYIGVAPKLVFKSIVFKDFKKDDSILAIVSGNQQVDKKLLAKAAGSKSVKAASLAEVEIMTGLRAGGISALALITKRFRFFLDISALNYEKIYVSAGNVGLNVSLSPQDFIRICRIKVAPIAINND